MPKSVSSVSVEPEDVDGNVELQPRKRRRTRACDQCKISRVKCEDVEMNLTIGSKACKACRKSKQECTYTTPVRKRGPHAGTTNKYVENNQDSNLSNSSPSVSDNFQQDDVVSSGQLPHSRVERMDNFDPKLSKSQSQSQDVRYSIHGIPSNLIDELLVTYFTHVHNLWPVIYKPQFTPQSTSPTLLLAMLCVASCVAPETTRNGFDNARLFQMAEQSLRSCWGEMRIDLVQATLLLSLRQTGCGDKQSSSWYAGQACTMALSLGLHNALRSGAIDTLDEQIRSRVWWSCYLIDKCLAEEIGRPCLLRYRGCTTPLPSLTEMDELEMWPPLPVTSAPLPPSVKTIKPRRGHVISAFVWTCRLAMIVENILELDLQGPPISDSFDNRFQIPNSPGQMEETIAAQLSDFRTSLPPFLNPDLASDIPPLPQVAILIAWHATATIIFYSRYIPTRTNSSTTPSSASLHSRAYTVCADAANTTLQTIRQLDRHGLLNEACADFLYIMCLTALFEAFDSTNPDAEIAKRSRDNLSECCNWLREFSSSWPAASAQKLFFEGLIQGGMRLCSPSIDVSPIDTAVSPISLTSPTTRSPTVSISFPNVHHALSTVQGERLAQPAQVEVSNFLQLPHYYWNNWNQVANLTNNVNYNAEPSYPMDVGGMFDSQWFLDIGQMSSSSGIGNNGDHIV